MSNKLKKKAKPMIPAGNKNHLIQARKQQLRDDELIEASYRVFMTLGLTVLHDKYGYGEARLKRFIAGITDLMDSYQKGYINIQDLEETLKAETGMAVSE